MTIRLFKSNVLETRHLNSKVKYFKFSVPEDFEFKSGQYLMISFFVDGKKFRNPYSITSTPNQKFVEFCIKLIGNGKSFNFIKNLKKGDKIELFGPAGKFVIDDSSKNKDLIFISIGTGIAPLKSMISFLLEKGFRKRILLLKGFRNEDGILYEKEFSKLKKKYENFKFYNILSQPKNKNFEDKGYVQNFLDKYVSGDFKGDFYLCGLNKMIKDIVKILENKDIKKDRIFFEKYD